MNDVLSGILDKSCIWEEDYIQNRPKVSGCISLWKGTERK